MRIRLEFVPNDCWVGVYWRKKWVRRCGGDWEGTVSTDDPGSVDFLAALAKRSLATNVRYDIWVCLLPMFPVHLTWYRPLTPTKESTR